MGAGGPGATSHHQGEGMTEPVHQPGVPFLLWCPKPHTTACSTPGKRRKPQSESRSGKHLFSPFSWDMGGHPESHQLTGLPQPGTATKKEMKSQRLSLWCSTEHKNPALKTKTRKRETGRATRGETARDIQPIKTGEGVQRLTPHQHTSARQQSFPGK